MLASVSMKISKQYKDDGGFTFAYIVIPTKYPMDQYGHTAAPLAGAYLYEWMTEHQLTMAKQEATAIHDGLKRHLTRMTTVLSPTCMDTHQFAVLDANNLNYQYESYIIQLYIRGVGYYLVMKRKTLEPNVVPQWKLPNGR